MINNVNYESTITHAGIASSKGSLMTTLFQMVHEMNVKSLEKLVFDHLKQYLNDILLEGNLDSFY